MGLEVTMPCDWVAGGLDGGKAWYRSWLCYILQLSASPKDDEASTDALWDALWDDNRDSVLEQRHARFETGSELIGRETVGRGLELLTP
jgi:hypothetical protein